MKPFNLFKLFQAKKRRKQVVRVVIIHCGKTEDPIFMCENDTLNAKHMKGKYRSIIVKIKKRQTIEITLVVV